MADLRWSMRGGWPLAVVVGLVCLAARGAGSETVMESARRIPVVADVDVVVVGGSLGGVAAAVAAKEAGASAMLVAGETYLGEDLCATLRLWLEPGEKAEGALTSRIFAKGSPATNRLRRVCTKSAMETVPSQLASPRRTNAPGSPGSLTMISIGQWMIVSATGWTTYSRDDRELKSD